MKPPFTTMLMQIREELTEARQPFTCNSSRVSETATHFLHQIDLSAALSNAAFKSYITDRSSLLVRNEAEAILPSKILLDLTGNTLFVYFDGPKSTSANTLFYLCASPDFTEVDSTTAFTNCGITNYWGFNETSGTTAYDYAGSVNITLHGMTPNDPGQFNRSVLAAGTSDWAASSSNLNYANATTMVMSMTLKRNSVDQEKTTVRYGNFSVAYFLMQFNGSNTLFVHLNGPRITSTEALGPTGAYHTYTAVFNGSLSNEDRVKLYYDGALKTVSAGESYPTEMPATTYPVYMNHDGGWGQPGNYDNVYFMTSATEGFILDRYRVLFEPSTFYTLGTIIV